MKLQILIVEDNPADVFLLEQALTGAGLVFDLDVCRDGDEALERLSTGERPNLLILDLNLPKVDGWEVLDACKAVPQIDQVPVVVLSSSQSPRDQARAATIARGLYLTKPADLDEFLQIGHTVRRFIEENLEP